MRCRRTPQTTKREPDRKADMLVLRSLQASVLPARYLLFVFNVATQRGHRNWTCRSARCAFSIRASRNVLENHFESPHVSRTYNFLRRSSGNRSHRRRACRWNRFDHERNDRSTGHRSGKDRELDRRRRGRGQPNDQERRDRAVRLIESSLLLAPRSESRSG